MTCKKPPRGRKGSDRDMGSHFICAGPLTSPCPCAQLPLAMGHDPGSPRSPHQTALGWGAQPCLLSPARPRLSPLPGALTPFHYCTARCDRDSSATGKEGQPARWSQRWPSCWAGGTEGEPGFRGGGGGRNFLALSPSWLPRPGAMLGGCVRGGSPKQRVQPRQHPKPGCAAAAPHRPGSGL